MNYWKMLIPIMAAAVAMGACTSPAAESETATQPPASTGAAAPTKAPAKPTADKGSADAPPAPCTLLTEDLARRAAPGANLVLTSDGATIVPSGEGFARTCRYADQAVGHLVVMEISVLPKASVDANWTAFGSLPQVEGVGDAAFIVPNPAAGPMLTFRVAGPSAGTGLLVRLMVANKGSEDADEQRVIELAKHIANRLS